VSGSFTPRPHPRAADGLDPAAAHDEAARIVAEYARRRRELPWDFYSLFRPAVLFAKQQRVRAVLDLLRHEGLADLRERRILEIGCGHGDWLADLEAWGARRDRLAAIELDPMSGREAQARLAACRDERGAMIAPGADVRVGDATRLPWTDGAFDLVLQSTVFSSVLHADVRRAIAAEMARVLGPGGAILWYDLRVDNPRNPGVRGLQADDIRALFPGFRARLRRITLAPPVARRLVPASWLAAELLERLVVLNTHYLGLLRREDEVP
jgi:SAM-dependent methyltransferase